MTAPTEATAKRNSLGLVGGLALSVAGIIGAVFVNEGGYVNNPNDPGGATNHGVTQAVAREAGYKGDMRYFPKYCKGPSDVCAEKIYFQGYILKPGFLPVIEAEPAVGQELVDSAVNFGPPRPSCWFQQAINEQHFLQPLKVDCKVGTKTVLAYRDLQRHYGKVQACVSTLDKLDAKQRAEYDRLARVNPKLKVFHRGWINHRIGNVDRKMCGKGL